MRGEPSATQYRHGDLAEMIRDATVADAFGIASVHVAAWRETYPGLVPASFLERLSASPRVEVWAERIVEMRHDPGTLVRVVSDDETGEIVGFTAGLANYGHPEREPIVSASGDVTCRAELSALYLLARVQGRGYGRRLVGDVRARFTSLGSSPIGLWVVVGNRAEAFYRHLGARPIAEKTVELDGAQIAHRGYAFDLDEA